MKKLFLLPFTAMAINLAQAISPPDEGMYPMSELARLNLQAKGMMLTPEQLFSTEGVSLVQALVRVGGCTGSFVSPNGLIITNHHCAFGAVAAASSVDNDYISNGFLAVDGSLEIPATGLTVRITTSYEDVSERVMAAVKGIEDPAARLAGIRAAMRQIEAEEAAKAPALKHEVSEMFLGRSYVLFHYQTINDIRLVYVPPRNIGEFGGESDNWMWPRHNGDFAFVRAYVAPDGSGANFSKDNVPFKPANHLTVNPNGVQEEDFVFIMGYPGRTFRHYPAAYLEYQRDYLLPYTSKTFDWLIDYMKALGKVDEAKGIALASRQKSLANVTKNYKGKLQGMRRIGLVENKRNEELDMQKQIAANPALAERYGNLMMQLDSLYGQMKLAAPRSMWMNYLLRNSASMQVAVTIAEARMALELAPKAERASMLIKLTPKLRTSIESAFGAYDAMLDRDFMAYMLQESRQWPKDQQWTALTALKGKGSFDEKLESMLNRLFSAKGGYGNKEAMLLAFDKNPMKFIYRKDELAFLASEVFMRQQELRYNDQQINGRLSQLLPEFLELKLSLQSSDFVPDANSTLRLTFGYIRGYEPEDGVYQAPFTTISGLIAKGEASGDYELNQDLEQAYARGNMEAYIKPSLKDVPVGILYNMDTTGGNSGSPVMNAKGELIGVNFDRAYTATINDFAWNEAYSRSIGVDIRFVLWVVDKVANASFLLEEMGIKP
ncbi:MAG: S46 family peptidase [Bacteroidia bacterium]